MNLFVVSTHTNHVNKARSFLWRLIKQLGNPQTGLKKRYTKDTDGYRNSFILLLNPPSLDPKKSTIDPIQTPSFLGEYLTKLILGKGLQCFVPKSRAKTIPNCS